MIRLFKIIQERSCQLTTLHWCLGLGWVAIEMEIQMLLQKITQEVIFLSRWEAANLYEKEFTKNYSKTINARVFKYY